MTTEIALQKKFSYTDHTIALVGLFFSIPAAVYLVGFGLKKIFEKPWFADFIDDVLDEVPNGLHMLVFFAPVLAFVMNAMSVFRTRIETTKEKVDCQFSILRKWSNLAVLSFSAGIILVYVLLLLNELFEFVNT